MVGIVEGILIACALALDVYAYKKMKDAEVMAEHSAKRETNAPTAIATTTTIEKEETKEEPEEEAPKEEWVPPIAYETHYDQTGDEIRILREELKTDFQNLNEKVEVVDERMKENHASVEEKIDSINARIENPEIEIPEEKLTEILGGNVTDRLKKLGKKLDSQGDKLLEIENKVDRYVIGAPDTMLIKKDIREEFAPLYQVGKKIDELSEKITKRINKVEKKTTAARKSAEENKARNRIASKKLADEISKMQKQNKKVTTTKRTSQAAKTRKRRESESKGGDITITTKVPRGTEVNTEVQTKKKK